MHILKYTLVCIQYKYSLQLIKVHNIYHDIRHFILHIILVLKVYLKKYNALRW